MRTAREEDRQIITDFFPDEGQPFGSLNKPALLSRWTIDDTDFDDLVNWISFGKFLQQTPSLSAVIATLPAPAIWISAQPLNGVTYLFCLCTNSNVYQVSLGGTVTAINGATAIGSLADIANWQGTTILISDSAVNKVYSWNGSTFATVFSSQPCSFITVYGGRLWMTSGTGGVAVTFTAGGTFNSLGGDSGTINITEYDCPPPVLGMIPSQGMLYLIGYNWVQVIGNLYDTGTPAVLQVTRQTAADQAGMISKWSLIQYSNSIYYTNLNGIWAFSGGSTAWASEEVGGFFQALILANSSFSTAFGYVNQLPCLFWNICWSNAGTTEYTVLGLDVTSIGSGKPRWFRVVYGNLSFITSGVNQAAKGGQIWAVDTAGNLTQLFGGAATVTSKANTKLWNFGTRIRWKEIERAGVLMVVPASATVTAVAVDQSLNTYSPQLQSANPAPTNIQWIYSGGSTATWSGTTTNIVAIAWQYSTLGAATWKYGSGATATFGKASSTSGPVTWATGTSVGAIFSPLEFYFPLQCQQFGLNLTTVSAGAILQAFGIEYKTTPADWGL